MRVTATGDPSTIGYSDVIDGGPVSAPSDRSTLAGGGVYNMAEWTRRWWNILPEAYRRLDELQNPEDGGYPLGRFMDGPGRIGGEMRQVSDDLYAGNYTNPAAVPDNAVRWLAQMLGVGEKQRTLPAAELREFMVDLTQSGRSAVGTRQAIGEVVKRYLSGDRQVLVGPSTSDAHTIVILVRADEVPNADLVALAANIKGSGVIPAGHVVKCATAAPTWDAYEAGVGSTWNDFEQTVSTWQDSDSVGVVLE